MDRIILVTSSFPYYPGEQFLETEIKYYDGLAVTIMPMSSNERIRKVSSNIEVDKYLTNQPKSLGVRIKYLLKAFFKNKLVYQEIVLNKVFSVKKLKGLFVSISNYERFYDIFDNYFEKEKDLSGTVIYTYWNTEATYALQSLKKKYGYKLVSRIHRFDLYKERRPGSYIPLKHLFTNHIDKIFTITESANEYLSKTYGFKNQILELSKLGVNDCLINSQPSVNRALSLVSCSFLVDLKRIDKIIDALFVLSKTCPLIKFNWIHIGSGSLENTLKQYAIKKLSNLDGIRYDFLGFLDNQEVYEFYRTNRIDVFVNVSESEGVPVSIMEAMSCHIPIIAPDIGGISDMVSNGVNGILLSGECRVDELVKALSNVEFFKIQETRENSYKQYLEKYNARNNYTKFVETLKGL